MTFNTIADDLRRTVNEAQGPLQSLSEQETSAHPQPGKWSKKEILGHLIDSATNNHQRFVRAALYVPVTSPRYGQDALAKLQRCNDVAWALLMRLWETDNRSPRPVMAVLTASAVKSPTTSSNH